MSKFEISHFLTHKSRWIEFLLFFVHGTDTSRPPPQKNFAKKKKEKKNTRRRRRDETKRMRRRSLRLLLFVAHVSLFSFSSSRGAECPLEIEKIDLNGLGNACGDATDPGKTHFSIIFRPRFNLFKTDVAEVHRVSGQAIANAGYTEEQVKALPIDARRRIC